MRKTLKTSVLFATITDVFECYESISDFVNALNARPVDPYYKDIMSSHKTGEYREKFTGTKSFEEADSLLKNGDLETVKKMDAKARNIKQAKGVKNTITRGPVGFVPNIPAYLSGNPNNMFSVRSQSYKSTKVINFVINSTISYDIDGEDLATFGVRLLNIVVQLEAKGYRLNVFKSDISQYKDSGKNKGVLLVKIKDSGKPLNLTKVAYPLANPSFYRRHVFNWIEKSGNTRSTGYGAVLPSSSCKSILAKHFAKFVYIDTAESYSDSEEDLLNEVNRQL